jgi:alkylation response protein AidB-like acyl-CoA dehydrogenase
MQTDLEQIHHPSTLLQTAWVETIRSHAAEAEKLGKLHPEQLKLVYRQQWFNLLSPVVYGGLQTPLPKLVAMEEALSWADGSLGWVVTLCCGAGWFGGFLEPGVARQVYADVQVCIAGSGAATGTAEITGDGYIINGSWKYASGVHHATYITVNCLITKNGGPVLDDDGVQLIRPFILNRADVGLLPGWKYMGMVATGSDAYQAKSVYADKSRAFKIDAEAAVIAEQLYTYPFLQLAEATLAANLAGMAVHFMDLCVPAFAHKATNIRRVNNTNVNAMNNALANAKKQLNQVRRQFFEAVEGSWQHPNDELLLKQVSYTSRLLAKTARESVDLLYPYCGLLAASPDTEINRVWRDVHTASQHALLTFME